MKTKVLIISLVASLAFVCNADAQCAMCRAVLENEAGQGVAKGINNGIMYLMSIPYILIGGLGTYIYFKYFRKKQTPKQ